MDRDPRELEWPRATPHSLQEQASTRPTTTTVLSNSVLRLCMKSVLRS